MTAATIRLVWANEDLGIAQVGPVCLVVWHGPVTRQLFDRQRAALEASATQYEGRAGLVCVVGSNSPPPNATLRQASLDMVKRLGDRLAWVVCVIEGDDLHAAMTRSVLAGMSSLLPGSKPTVTFMADVPSAVTMVAEHFDAASAANLSQTHAQLLTAMRVGAGH
jgi:hypothetical protein